MSAVELPQVTSARSTSSRGSVRSAGSSASDKSSRSDRNQRSHRAATYGPNVTDEEVSGDIESEEEESEGEGSNDGNEEEEPQESSGGLWDEVESFLNRPSPSLSVLAKADKKAASGSVLPTLKPEQSRRKGSEPESYSGSSGGAAARTGARPVGRPLYQPSSTASSSKVIDPKLLQEAFAYAQKVSLMDYEDDQQEQADVIHERRHPLARSSSRNITSFSSTTSSSSSSLLGGKDGSGGPKAPSSHGAAALKKQNSSGGAKSEDAKLRKKTAASKATAYGLSAKPTKKKSERRIKEAAQWDPSSAPSGGDSASSDPSSNGASRKHMDPQVMQALVSNFQNGTTLDELRKELAASQQSMTLSRQVLHDAAKAFFQPPAR